MAHECIFCGDVCYCSGDIDDTQGMSDENCKGCGCETGREYNGDEDDFEPCSECDGRDACADFGCAVEHGIVGLAKFNFIEQAWK